MALYTGVCMYSSYIYPMSIMLLATKQQILPKCITYIMCVQCQYKLAISILHRNRMKFSETIIFNSLFTYIT